MAIRAIAKWSVAVVAVKLSVHIVHVIHVRPRHRRLCQAENGICTVKVLASRRMNWKLYVLLRFGSGDRRSCDRGS
jgi:hypothetical protein